MKPFILHADAEGELREALDFYEGRRINLGGEFRQEFEAALRCLRADNKRLLMERGILKKAAAFFAKEAM